MGDLRTELDSRAWEKWPHKGCHNGSELCYRPVPRGGQSLGEKSVVIPGALGMGAVGNVPWSLVLVKDEDSPSELPAWGQARWAGSKKQQGLPTSDLFRDTFEPLGFLYDPNGGGKDPL